MNILNIHFGQISPSESKTRFSRATPKFGKLSDDFEDQFIKAGNEQNPVFKLFAKLNAVREEQSNSQHWKTIVDQLFSRFSPGERYSKEAYRIEMGKNESILLELEENEQRIVNQVIGNLDINKRYLPNYIAELMHYASIHSGTDRVYNALERKEQQIIGQITAEIAEIDSIDVLRDIKDFLAQLPKDEITAEHPIGKALLERKTTLIKIISIS